MERKRENKTGGCRHSRKKVGLTKTRAPSLLELTEEDDKINKDINKLKYTKEKQGIQEYQERGQLTKDVEEGGQNEEENMGKEIEFTEDHGKAKMIDEW